MQTDGEEGPGRFGAARSALRPLALALLVLGCGGEAGDTLGPGPPRTPNFPDDRGPLLAQSAVVRDLTWSADGAQLFFRHSVDYQCTEQIEPGVVRITTGDRSVIAGLPAAGGSSSSLYTATGTRSLQRPGALSWLYFVADDKTTNPPCNSESSAVLRLSLDASSAAEHVYTPSSSGYASLAVSDDGRFLALKSPFAELAGELYDVQTGQRTSFTVGAEPLGFSADGTLLLDSRGFVTSTADGSSQQITDASGAPAGGWIAAYWVGTNLRLVFAESLSSDDVRGHRVSLYDSGTNTTRELVSITSPGWIFSGPAIPAAAVSPDGRKLVLWIQRPDLAWSEAPGEWPYQLHLVDLVTGGARVIATVAGLSVSEELVSLNSMSFSPDGTKLAYALGRGRTCLTACPSLGSHIHLLSGL